MNSVKWLQSRSGKVILSVFLLALLIAIVVLLKRPPLESRIVEPIVLALNGIDFSVVAGLVSNFTLVLLGIIVPIFVLTVTLIGNAARLAKEQQAATEHENKEGFDRDITDLNKRLEKIRPEGIAELKEQIDNLEIKRRFTEDKIKKIETKYASLGLKNSVLVPAQFFVASLVFNKLLLSLSGNHLWQFISLAFGVFFLYLGIKKIVFTLQVVQEVSLVADSRKSEELRNSLVEALKTVEVEREPKPFVRFVEKSPFVLKPNTEAIIGFDIDLKIPGNKEAKNVDVWFLISPEIEILPDPSHGESFRQSAEWLIPNANTVRYKFDLVRKHTRSPGKLKIKTTVPGKFKLWYKVDCENHVESADADKGVDILVKD